MPNTLKEIAVVVISLYLLHCALYGGVFLLLLLLFFTVAAADKFLNWHMAQRKGKNSPISLSYVFSSLA